MGKVVTVMNMKGGVGKTTVTVNLGAGMANYMIDGKPRSVLLIDYDPQFNLSQVLLEPKTYFSLEAQKKTCLSILQDPASHRDPFKILVPGNHAPPPPSKVAHRVIRYATTHLDLIPSTLDLMYLALGDSSNKTHVFDERFEKFIAACRPLYDLIMIDCHPAGSILTRTSLRNSDHVLIPVAPQPFALRGIGLMMKFISSAQSMGNGPRPHILFNLAPRTGQSKEELEVRNTPDLAANCFASTLKKYKAFSDPMAGKNFAWKSGKSFSKEAMSNLLAVLTELSTRCSL